jgi:hypothetical protein
MQQTSNRVETIIDGSVDPAIIHEAVETYMEGIASLAFPKDLSTVLGLSTNLDDLKKDFVSRARTISQYVEEIMLEINKRAVLLRSDAYRDLCAKDTSLWKGNSNHDLLFGIIACVDKGVPAEAVAGPEVSLLGRTLGGDIAFSYIPSKHAFVPNASALIKRFIHYGRQGHTTLIEPLIEHTSCGRRGQILANEGGHGRQIPSLEFIFDHIDALQNDLKGDTRPIADMWQNWKRQGVSVITPDAGLYAGVIQKIAQRQALCQLSHDITVISPIEIYEKDTGNFYTGIDTLSTLTDTSVKKEGGFTRDVLQKLAKSKRIFALSAYKDAVFTALSKNGTAFQGKYPFTSLQTDWLAVMTDLVTVTQSLWMLYAKKDARITTFVDAYLKGIYGTIEKQKKDVTNRLIHHLFHMTSYTYLLDTLTVGNPPGAHHIEQYLATGNRETGMKPRISLSQGDLDRPDANEIFTGYSVLLHSAPGHDGTPIPVTIKLDTDRFGDLPMSTEETNVALDDLGIFLKLWPYFLVGDLIPILMVKGKKFGGVSRLGLSVLKSFGDIITLFEQPKSPLPRFVPATNSANEVVLVPAKNVLEEGCLAGHDLKAFRARMIHLADRYSDIAVQQRFASVHM